MKKALFIAMIAALTVVSGSCGKNETPAAVTTAAQPTKTYPELNFPDTDWADNNFNEAVNKYSEFTETDIMGMASACAKGVAKSQKCAFDEAWDASYSVVTELTECSKKIRDMLILGSATWSVSDKELALETGARLLELNKEVNEYISLSGTTIESEILSIMNEKAAEVTEPEPQEPELVTIDWDDVSFIGNITAFAQYDEMKLAQAASLYTRGLAAASGLQESEVAEEAFNAVKAAKENADIVAEMLPFRESWTPELEAAMTGYACEFTAFAEMFGEYAALVKENPTESVESTGQEEAIEPEQATETQPPVPETEPEPVQ